MDTGHLFDVKGQLVGYGAYHSHPVNVAIHRIFVPAIVWTAAVLAAKPVFFPQYSFELADWLKFELTPFTSYFLICIVYYLLLEPFAALVYAPLAVLSYGTAIAFREQVPHALAIATAIHIVSWIAQFAGHGMAEKRAPALMDNLFGAIVAAPFFVHLENMFDLGYRPKLQKEMNTGIAAKKAQFKAQEAAKTNGHSNGSAKKDL